MSKKYPLVIVEWDDANSCSGWRDKEDLDLWMASNEWQCRNVGWLVRETKDFYLIAARHAPNDGQYGLLERLPRKMVRKITRLKV